MPAAIDGRGNPSNPQPGPAIVGPAPTPDAGSGAVIVGPILDIGDHHFGLALQLQVSKALQNEARMRE